MDITLATFAPLIQSITDNSQVVLIFSISIIAVTAIMTFVLASIRASALQDKEFYAKIDAVIAENKRLMNR